MLPESPDWTDQLAALTERAGRGEPPPDAGEFAEAPAAIRRIADGIVRIHEALAAQTEALLQARANHQAIALEMNHRVRNNLQIISSFLNLQAEALPAEQERIAIERTRLRVAALALVHRLILDRGEQTRIASGQLIDAICALITESIEARLGFDVECHAEHRSVPIDKAVPLALWTVEAVEVMAMRGSNAPDAQIAVRLDVDGNELALTVRGHGLGEPVEADLVPERLLDSLARQMGSRLERRQPAPASEEVSLKLRLDAEEQ